MYIMEIDVSWHVIVFILNGTSRKIKLINKLFDENKRKNSKKDFTRKGTFV